VAGGVSCNRSHRFAQCFLWSFVQTAREFTDQVMKLKRFSLLKRSSLSKTIDFVQTKSVYVKNKGPKHMYYKIHSFFKAFYEKGHL
jgi:hypothetical protein